MKKRPIIAIITSLFLMATTLSGFAPAKASTPKLDADQTLNLSLQDITTLNSLLVTDTYSLTVLTECMEGLTRVENDGSKDIVKPAQAKSWDISKNKLVWTFHLRNNLWSDGKKVTASDYVYAWKKLLDPKVASSYANFIYCVKGAQEYNTGKGTADGVGVKAVNDSTFQVTLKQPVPHFLQLTSFKTLLPLRKDKVEAGGVKYGQDISTMVFNGPFIVEQWVKGSKVVLKKNPKYWDASSVKLQTVNLINILETETEKKMFESKQIDEMQLPDTDYLAKVKSQISSGDLTFLSRGAPETRYFAFNTKDKNKIMTNAKIRKALSITIEREKLLKYIYKDYSPAYGWIPPSVAVGNVEYRNRVTEPMKAIMKENPKKLFQDGLKELGLDPKGKYTLEYLQSGNTTLKRSLAEYYQNLWQSTLGVTIKIDVVADFGQLSARVDKGDYQICLRDWVADYNDPSSFFDVFRSNDPNNTSLYNSKKYDDLIKKADVETNPAKRLAYETQAENLLTAVDCAVAPVYYGTKKMLTRSYVKGLQYPNFVSSFEFKNAYISGK